MQAKPPGDKPLLKREDCSICQVFIDTTQIQLHKGLFDGAQKKQAREQKPSCNNQHSRLFLFGADNSDIPAQRSSPVHPKLHSIGQIG
jgi:hypothetical protein